MCPGAKALAHEYFDIRAHKYFQHTGFLAYLDYVVGVFRGRFFMIFDDFLKTKKMRDVRTIILAAVSRRDLCYVSENKGFCPKHKPWFSDT